MARKAKLALGGLISIVFYYYIIASVLTDAVATFLPGMSDIFYYLTGLLALAFIVLSFIWGVKERDKTVLGFFAIIFIVIIIAFLGVI